MTEKPDATPTASHEISADLVELLVCPLGRAELEHRDGKLVCTRCGPEFEIDDGIPIMIPDQAELPEGIASLEELSCQSGEGECARTEPSA